MVRLSAIYASDDKKCVFFVNKVDSFVKNHIIKMLTIKKLMNTMAVCREAAGYPLKMKSKEDLSGTQYRVHAGRCDTPDDTDQSDA